MRKDITVAAEARDTRGKNEARRLRVKGFMPAVVYGGSGEPAAVAVSPKEVARILHSKTGHNTIFLVKQGRVVWTYSTGRGGEIDDVWMLSNGHVLFARQFHVEEVTPQKKVVWHYDPPKGTEIHTCQPIGLDKVLFVQNGLPPKAILINKASGAVEMEHALPAPSETDQKTVHPQFRRFRQTAAGTYAAAYKVSEGAGVFSSSFTLALFPRLSRERDLSSAYRLALRVLLQLAFPLAVGVALLW